jgi:demethylmenaquinone methyltransferase/2-methoxy-6-polyprenyl-1,4-benzoquinol methylase
LKLSKRIDGNNESFKTHGVFVILETSVPDKTPYKQGYNFYSKTYFLLLGNCSKDDVAYGIFV